MILNVTVRTSESVSQGVHIGRGYVVTALHGTTGGNLTVNGHAARVYRTSPPDDLALLWCEAFHASEPPKLGRKPKRAMADMVPHMGRVIAAYRTGRKSGPGASGSGYYEDGVLVGIVVGVQRDGDEYAVSLDRILETETE